MPAPASSGRWPGIPRGWLAAQLVPERELPVPLDELPSTGDDAWAFFGWLIETGMAARRAKRWGRPVPDAIASLEATFHPRYERALAARFQVAAATDTPFRERLVHFWSGHFVISAVRPVTLALPPSFERDVVRPHVVGRFEDMLLASTKHPGMLLYLDNERNLGPRSKEAREPRKRLFQLPIDPPTGLNENLAREVLELHTLGVHGGYTQADVTRFAKVLSGWRIRVRPFFRGFYDAEDLMRFDADSHEPGPPGFRRARPFSSGRSRCGRRCGCGPPRPRARRRSCRPRRDPYRPRPGPRS